MPALGFCDVSPRLLTSLAANATDLMKAIPFILPPEICLKELKGVKKASNHIVGLRAEV
jgi:hypothetical protein